MSDLVVSWSVAWTAIAFLVLAGWRNHRRGKAVTPAATRLATPAVIPQVPFKQQLICLNAALLAEAEAGAGERYRSTSKSLAGTGSFTQIDIERSERYSDFHYPR